tara:strand:- start:1127 stop:1819 length:693 start_codon:yes stop_codon:yes gene_type:complete
MIALMQPYFFPKLSYWQLIHSVDTFVIYDDVQYKKGGWINRNRILVNNSIKTISIPLKHDNFKKMINERFLAENWNLEKKRLLVLIKDNYKKSINFEIIYPLIIKILNFNDMNLSKFITNSIIEITNYLEINTKIINSSSLNISDKFKKESKIIEICKILNSTKYVNAIGGKKIYDKDDFKNLNIELNFLYPANLLDNINSASFDLSIIDTLMNIKKKQLQKELTSFKLI